MANSQNTSGHFQPLDLKAIWPGVFILEGNQTTSSGSRGVLDLAYNINTLYGQMQPRFMICHGDGGEAVVTTTTGSFQDLVSYRWQPMRFNQGNRADIEMQFHVTITTGTPATGSIRVTTSNSTATTSGVTTDGWYTVNVTMDPTKSTAELLVVAVNAEAASVIRIDTVVGGQRQLTAATALTVVETGGFHPQDTTGGGANSSNPEWGADSALNVRQAIEAMISIRQLAKEGVRDVIQHCFPQSVDLGASPGNNHYRATDTEFELLNQFWYERRDFVDTLKVYATGFTEGFTGSGGEGAAYRLKVMDTVSDAFVLDFTFDTAITGTTAVFTDPWPTNDAELTLPDLTSPLKIGLFGKQSSESPTRHNGQLVALSVFEKRPFF